MPLATDVMLIGLYDAKLSPMTADASSAPTYGTGIDCPGVTTMNFAPTMESKEAKGDGGVLASFAKITGGEVEITMAKFPLAMLPIVQGGTLTATGTTPNQKQTYALKSTDAAPGYWKLEGAWDPGEPGMGDVHLVVYKVKVSDPPKVEVADANGDYGTVTLKGKVVFTDSDKKLVEIIANETKTAIA